MPLIKHRIELLNLLPPNPVVCELGVAEGLFSRDLLVAGVGKLYSVDNWAQIKSSRGDGGYSQEWHDANYENAMKLLSPFGDRSVVLRGLTTEMAKHVPDGELDMLYHDAGHDKKSVMDDLTCWFPKVKTGGIIGFHDYLMPEYDVKRAAEEFCRPYGYELIVIPENAIKDAGAYFVKT